MLLIILYTTATRHRLFGNLDGYAEHYARSFQGTSRSRHIELADEVSWADFAYCTYATAPDNVCNSLMLLESLHRVNVKADRLLLYSNQWDIESKDQPEAELLRRARDLYGVKIQPIEILTANSVRDYTWAAGFTKWLAFNQTQYKRVMTLNSDGTVLRPMDELFLMPSTAVALPRAYWLNDSLSAQITLVQPSVSSFAAIQKQMENRKIDDYDMEIINAIYGDSCAILPHRPYNLLTGEFRSADHAAYLGGKDERWDPEEIMEETKYIHFSDWPLPKPWAPHSEDVLKTVMPKCGGKDDCADRRIWLRLYEDFRERRKNVCGPEYAEWEAAEMSMKVQQLLGEPNPALRVAGSSSDPN
ncbi:hypothetical protein LTR85_005353 [Meristemomyces frigidus]|nr:hypothetical protein LTR85_005353 [Meristemomyces frigidus]